MGSPTPQKLQVSLFRNRRSRSMARNFSPKILLRHSGLLAESRDQVEIQEVRPEMPHTVQKQKVNHLACLAIAESCLSRSHLLPNVDHPPPLPLRRSAEFPAACATSCFCLRAAPRLLSLWACRTSTSHTVPLENLEMSERREGNYFPSTVHGECYSPTGPRG